jgi:hypothetical protein
LVVSLVAASGAAAAPARPAPALAVGALAAADSATLALGRRGGSRTLAYPRRAALARHAYWSRYFGVPVYGFRTGEACSRDSLGCVYGLRPPMYVHTRVLAIADRQLANRRRPAKPGPGERTAATNGINVLLHEWAHAGHRVANEAQADCWTGQWLWDLERKERFSASKVDWHQRYHWSVYRWAIDTGWEYGDEACFSEWVDAPGLYSGRPYQRWDARGNAIPPQPPAPPEPPPPPPPPPPPAPFAIRDGYVSNTHFGPQLWLAGPVKQRIYLNLRYESASTSGHTVSVQWIRPDGTTASQGVWAVEAGYTGSSYYADLGTDRLAPMAGRWRVVFELDGGVQKGEYGFDVERHPAPVAADLNPGGSFPIATTSFSFRWTLQQELPAADRLTWQAFAPSGALADTRTWTSLALFQSGSHSLWLGGAWRTHTGTWTFRLSLNDQVVWTDARTGL